jgi:prephenate dehydrogenase
VLESVSRHGFASHFVGSHPLAGDHRGGWEASREGLFRNATVYLTPAPEASAPARAAAGALWETLGAHPREISAAEHDRLLAWTSHLPQALASTLAATLAGRGISRAALGPGGRDTTRLAASPAALWAEILDDNRDEVLGALAALRSNLAALTGALEERDRVALAALLERASGWGRAGAGE